MKKIKVLFSVLSIFSLLAILTVFLVRRPSYSIQTEGKLYVFNKLSTDVTVFDLFKGKKITEIPIEIETHEATVLTNQERIAVANYGTSKIKGKSIIIIKIILI